MLIRDSRCTDHSLRVVRARGRPGPTPACRGQVLTPQCTRCDPRNTDGPDARSGRTPSRRGTSVAADRSPGRPPPRGPCPGRRGSPPERGLPLPDWPRRTPPASSALRTGPATGSSWRRRSIRRPWFSRPTPTACASPTQSLAVCLELRSHGGAISVAAPTRHRERRAATTGVGCNGLQWNGADPKR